jgi:uncharacterized membrane protein YukC
MSDLIEIERTPGFSGADGSVSYKNANEAFKAYLKATGQPLTKENKSKFKAWLTAAKGTGKLDKLLQEKISKDSPQHNAEGDEAVKVKVEEKPKPKLYMGMKPWVAVGVTVAVVGLISWGVYAAVKARKAKKDGAVGAPAI